MKIIFNAQAIATASNTANYQQVRRILLAEDSSFRTTLPDEELIHLVGLVMYESVSLSNKIMEKVNKGTKILKPFNVSYKDESGKEQIEVVYAYHIGEAGSIVKAKNFGKVLKSMSINEKQQ